MCGIAGFSWAEAHLVKLMTDTLRHRGPDDEGIFVNEDVSLGHRRLAILGLSAHGHQPMVYEHSGRQVVITYNGEIYNFRELRQDLEDKGYTFKTATDTEIIPAAYLEWGVSCVDRFNGMWAFAIYDAAAQQLMLSRDRFGEKPLYYHLKNGKLIFASEIKAILDHPVKRQGNKKAVVDYLYRGAANHRLDSFFDEIFMLPPAHNAAFDLRTGNFTLYKYYELDFGNRRVSPDEFLATLRQSVQRRLVSDVPVSVSLSSGVDSTSVAALASEFTDMPVKAFTTATGKQIGDETSLISAFLAQYPQYELERSSLSEKSFCLHYREIIFHMDEPFARQSAYVRWEIANLAQQYDRKVLLNGEGADEILGGYVRFAPHFLLDLAKHFMLIRFCREIYSSFAHPERRTIMNAFRNDYTSPWFNQIQQKEHALDRQRRFQISFDPVYQFPRKFNGLKDYLYMLVSETSLPRLLNCNDKMTMANSVEARAPFLDHEFVNMVFSMDERDSIVNGCRKNPLRQAMKGRVANQILFRKDKDAFNAPIFEYLKCDFIQHRIKELFNDARTFNVFSSKAYLEEYGRFLSNKKADRLFLLHGFFLEEWTRIFEVSFDC